MERITISIETWHKSCLEEVSKNKGISVSELFRSILNDYLTESKPKHLRPLTEIPDEELNEYDRAVKAWCYKELKKMAKWYLDDLKS